MARPHPKPINHSKEQVNEAQGDSEWNSPNGEYREFEHGGSLVRSETRRDLLLKPPAKEARSILTCDTPLARSRSEGCQHSLKLFRCEPHVPSINVSCLVGSRGSQPANFRVGQWHDERLMSLPQANECNFSQQRGSQDPSCTQLDMINNYRKRLQKFGATSMWRGI
ncbi:hypothetical protein Bbelb_183450 [Branchiostoma belcheri]|nr:hypothetical protein Bbelb_183450 [Branchiostoma belcheri]